MTHVRDERRKEFVAPLGKRRCLRPLSKTSTDITGPYLVTPLRNKYLLTFIDQFFKWVEAYPILDINAETCARVYTSHILTRHCTGSTLLTDQGRLCMSAFLKETYKILGIRKVNTSGYHPSSNGMIERWHRSLHSGLF